ncbi:hypothetical protein ASPZODRAFT_139197 [Penicilliopsis zonata CBS 506.65]|uniref:Major facilitator superfamily (MFS) profile domain-containing protein n=1 Tax=Penicilliopsis zonata CBS 506.65 TaxID=1073090 RepID=A0A1L9SRK3_9EURO|nr:hypothetical protein ASPZODRAFT_139197 [Penicilliopsis zonata CBS 506.65]OJJ49842.1 hypothetical protein ASPZODRAFT_139197 [Penicilliopsis zonata CBS 506.65]
MADKEATRASSLSGQTIPNEGSQMDLDVEKREYVSSVNGGSKDGSQDGTTAEDENEYPGSFSLLFIIIALILAMFLVALDMTIVATAIPEITDEFNSLDQTGWYGSAFFLTVASFQSTWGKGYKYFNLKWTFLLAIFIFEIGSLICGVAQNSTTLIVGRAVAGAGAAGIASGVYTIIAFSAPPRQRPAFTGLLGATYAGASVIGPLLGGVFTTHVTWRWCFYINLPVGGLSAIIILFFFQNPPAARPAQADWKEKLLQMDLGGTFIIMAAVVCYLLAMQWAGSTKAWDSADVIGTLIGFGLLVIVFIINEWWMDERALVPKRLLKMRNFVVSCLFVVFSFGPMFVLIYYLPIYFQSIQGVSASESGVRNIPLILSVSIFSIVSGALITIFGHFVYLMIISSVITSIGCGLIYTLDTTTGSGKWIGYQILAGVGLGLGCQIPIIVNQAIVDPSDLASSSAFTLFCQTIGGAIWVSAGESAFVNRLVQKLPETAPGVDPAAVVAAGATALRQTFTAAQLPGILVAYMDGLTDTFLVALVLACVGFLVALFPKWESLKGRMTAGGAV